ncbi:unnamed protein product, partial [Discosporangium mesarthrocarpum]
MRDYGQNPVGYGFDNSIGDVLGSLCVHPLGSKGYMGSASLWAAVDRRGAGYKSPQNPSIATHEASFNTFAALDSDDEGETTTKVVITKET